MVANHDGGIQLIDTVVVEDGQGHLGDLDRVVELTTWLVKGA